MTDPYLAGVVDIGQFLDIGTGIPTADNTHEVAQDVAPECRVVYVDNDPVVLAHARALLTGVTAPTAYVDADVRDPGEVLARAARLLDFSQPVAVMLISVLHLIPDQGDPHAIAARLPTTYRCTCGGIIGSTVKAPAVLSVVAVLVGGALTGIVGALVAIPVAVAFRLLLDEVTFRRLDRS